MTERALEIWEELEKAISLVTTARRLIATGARFDLTALEGKVRFVCREAQTLEEAESSTMLPVMEALIEDLDHLSLSIESQQQPLAARLAELEGR